MPSPLSPPPTRTPLPRPLAEKSRPQRSDTGGFSTAISPQGSADNSREEYTPQGTCRSVTSEWSSANAVVDPSVVAVHGSVPPSPILRAQRAGKHQQSTNFPPPHRDWTDTKAEDADAETAHLSQAKDKTDGPILPSKTESIPLPTSLMRTANNSRVIAIDLEVVYPSHTDETVAPIFGTDMQLLDDLLDRPASQAFSPVSPVSPTEMKGTTSGLLLALKQLRALGHPLHLISTRGAADKGQVEAWLEYQRITVGTGDEDVVAALWFTDHVSPVTDAARFAKMNGGRDRAGEAKLKVLKAINAALFITPPQGSSQAIDRAFPFITTVQLLAKGLTQAKYHSNAAPDALVSSQGDHTRVERWGDVVAYVKAWDEAK